MSRDHFFFRKRNQLLKFDKSIKQGIDEKIKNLCDLINKSENYYTTSSCSGRILILIDSKEKKDGLFLFVNHDFITFEKLKKELNKTKNKTKNFIYFK